MESKVISIKRDIKVGVKTANALGLALVLDRTDYTHKKITEYHFLVLCFVFNLSITKYKKIGE